MPTHLPRTAFCSSAVLALPGADACARSTVELVEGHKGGLWRGHQDLTPHQFIELLTHLIGRDCGARDKSVNSLLRTVAGVIPFLFSAAAVVSGSCAMRPCTASTSIRPSACATAMTLNQKGEGGREDKEHMMQAHTCGETCVRTYCAQYERRSRLRAFCGNARYRERPRTSMKATMLC